ncbi:MAG TPA: hypothetical protein VHP32_06525 [Ignavibacteria bacterium]|nr:hypothetical protein [Ignavibacteria bacterium]
MEKHHIWMLIGCVLPVLLVFLMPVFNINGTTATLIFLIIIFLCHLLMMRHHTGTHQNNQNNSGE